MGFYSYTVIDNVVRDGFCDEPVGTCGRWIDKDIKTLRGLKNRISKWRAKPGTWVKVWQFAGSEFPYSNEKFRLVETYQVK
jgi:hypothetical protein